MPSRIVFATCDQFPGLYEEERELLTKVRARGHHAESRSWSDPGVDWKSFDLVVIRSTWDYFERTVEFRSWLDRLEKAGARVQNPVPLIRWNMDKLYLLDLAEQSVPIIPTKFVERGQKADLAAILEKYGWDEAVMKPTVSGGAFRTERVTRATAAAQQEAFAKLAAEVGAMVQPFAPEIVTEGEWSLFFFGGAFSHAVLKTPASGDYRVQPMFGGKFVRMNPEPALIAAAQKILTRTPEPLLYARVDGVRRGEKFLLMELEAIEPYLFLAAAPEQMDRYIDAVIAAAGA